MEKAKPILFGGLFGLLMGIYCAQRNYRDNLQRGLAFPTQHIWKDHILCPIIGRLQKESGNSANFRDFIIELDKVMGYVMEKRRVTNAHEWEIVLLSKLNFASNNTQQELIPLIKDLFQSLQ
jgi:hypothetical protein